MTSNYKKIREENKRAYGYKVSDYGKKILADMYSERSHFILEILQNAEDALSRRKNWKGSRRVSFDIESKSLRVSHFGQPFDEKDVTGICGIGESSKNVRSIGKFGIGFKSVYAYTDSPQISSGDQEFKIKNFVHPYSASKLPRENEETVIEIPFKPEVSMAGLEIFEALCKLGQRSILFLREIDEVCWNGIDGQAGSYRRATTHRLGRFGRFVSLVSTGNSDTAEREDWVVFERPVKAEGEEFLGNVELAFLLEGKSGKSRNFHDRVIRVARSPLTVYFPTIVETGFGFLIQGPFHTTPSREGISMNDNWNRKVAEECSELFKDTLLWLRDNGKLTVNILECMPPKVEVDGGDTVISTIEAQNSKLIQSERILPKHRVGYVSANAAMLARGSGLRELLSARQVRNLFNREFEGWISSDITQDKTSELRDFLINQAKVAEVTPLNVVSKMTKKFLEEQSDAWVTRFYKFLLKRSDVAERLSGQVPFVRLVDGTHVVPFQGDNPNAYLPGRYKTNLPTVRSEVLKDKGAKKFMVDLGLSVPNQVEDVIRNVVEKYRKIHFEVSDEEYVSDIERMVAAFDNAKAGERERLEEALSDASIVRACDCGDVEETSFEEPGDVYFSTRRLKNLFSGVKGIKFVDPTEACLNRRETKEFLRGIGVRASLEPVAVSDTLSSEEKAAIRKRHGQRRTSQDEVQDWEIVGISEIIIFFDTQGTDCDKSRAKELWESLCEVIGRRGEEILKATYKWTFSGVPSMRSLPSKFVRDLSGARWVPDGLGGFCMPRDVVFETLGWKENPALARSLGFRDDAVTKLAMESGVDPRSIEFIRQNGITIEDLEKIVAGKTCGERARGQNASRGDEESGTKEDRSSLTIGDRSGCGDHAGRNGDVGEGGDGGGGVGGDGGGDVGGTGSVLAGKILRGIDDGGGDRLSSGRGGGRESPARRGGFGGDFVSYISVHQEGDGRDGSTGNSENLELEDKAIDYIIEREPKLRRTESRNNKGFDLYEEDPAGNVVRWVEVKAISAAFDDRSVGISKAQLEYAQMHRSAYWLYVVENAGDDKLRKLYKIQDPFGLARTFTFDHGWKKATTE